MNTLYIILRTFPFWGIPLGVFLFMASMKGKAKGNKKLMLVGSLLVISGGLFLWLGGPFYAVPFVHEIQRDGIAGFVEPEDN